MSKPNKCVSHLLSRGQSRCGCTVIQWTPAKAKYEKNVPRLQCCPHIETSQLICTFKIKIKI